MLNRRNLFTGLGASLILAKPAIVLAQAIMPVKLIMPQSNFVLLQGNEYFTVDQYGILHTKEFVFGKTISTDIVIAHKDGGVYRKITFTEVEIRIS